MKVVANLDHAKAAKWRDDHASILAEIPEDAVRIELVHAEGGGYIMVMVRDEYAALFDENTQAS